LALLEARFAEFCFFSAAIWSEFAWILAPLEATFAFIVAKFAEFCVFSAAI